MTYDKTKRCKFCNVLGVTAKGLCNLHYNQLNRGEELHVIKKGSSKRTWPEEDVLILKQYLLNYGKSAETHRMVAARLNRTFASVVGESKKIISPKKRDDYWTDADIEALCELMSTCTPAQCAQYLGRTISSVRGKAQELAKNGMIESSFNHKNMNPFHMPASSILVAKTCLTCGQLLDAKMFVKRKQCKLYESDCLDCFNKKIKNRRRNKKKQSQKASMWLKAMQNVTIDSAINNGKEWTDSEVSKLEDISKPILQIALELGRTYSATSTARARYTGISVRKLNFKERRYAIHWLIHFPKAMEVLKQEFIRLGVPDDGWD